MMSESESKGLRPIAIFDSGVGGLPYLETARAAMPAESFVYLADRAGFPYGTKKGEEVRDRVVGLVSLLVERYDPKAIVIACNTASQAGLDAARKANPKLPIIGTVPAVKPAAEKSRSKAIGVMATARAVEDPYLDALVARYAKDLRVIRVAAQELVAFVERKAAFATAEEKREAARPFVKRFLDEGVDEIVLACTHFLHLRDDIAAVAGEGVEVVDSRAGVVKRLRAVLSERALIAGEGAASKGIFLVTGEPPIEAVYGRFAERFDLAAPDSIA
jgi:glutamate racemase